MSSTSSNVKMPSTKASEFPEFDWTSIPQEAANPERIGSLLHATGLLQKYPLSRIIWPNGPTPAPIMWIGEAGGAEEDRLKLGFVGPSGKVLRSTFERLSIPTQNIYCTNLCKVRPSRNDFRLFPADEIKNKWSLILHDEIARANPEIIFVFGRNAGRGFDNLTQPMPELYQWRHPLTHKFHTIAHIQHPSWVLRAGRDFNKNKRWQEWQREIRAMLRAMAPTLID